MRLSCVIPVLNEQPSLEPLYEEIAQVSRDHGYDIQIILVDDGSTDGSWETICALSGRDRRVQGIRLRRNFGKAAAISAGVEKADAQIVVTLDADLQDDPAEIPKLLQRLDSRLDLVSGWKKVRRDPLGKRVASRLFNFLVSRLTGVHLHDHNCGFKAYRRIVFNDVRLYGELHRFVPVLASAYGYRVGEVVVEHRPRRFGKSKYGGTRWIKGWLDLMTVMFLTSFNHRPQHLLGSIGLVSFSLGALGLVWMAVYWVQRMLFFPDWAPLHQRPLVIYSLGALLLGAQMLTMGFLAELIVSRDQGMCRPYCIAELAGESSKAEQSAQTDSADRAGVSSSTMQVERSTNALGGSGRKRT